MLQLDVATAASSFFSFFLKITIKFDVDNDDGIDIIDF